MKSKHLSSAQGFSLVELLVVIAVIAIIAAIAIPNIANITSQASVAKNQRNAQNIASVASAARAAGYTNNWNSVSNAVAVLTTNNGAGITITSGTNQLNFGVSGLSASDMGYTNNLSIQTNSTPDTLVYTP
jgi:type IV pilus assembly protein PilA